MHFCDLSIHAGTLILCLRLIIISSISVVYVFGQVSVFAINCVEHMTFLKVLGNLTFQPVIGESSRHIYLKFKCDNVNSLSQHIVLVWQTKVAHYKPHSATGASLCKVAHYKPHSPTGASLCKVAHCKPHSRQGRHSAK